MTCLYEKEFNSDNFIFVNYLYSKRVPLLISVVNYGYLRVYFIQGFIPVKGFTTSYLLS